MSYLLGVDVGTTYTAAATIAHGQAEVVPLGNRTSVVPTVVCLREDGELLIGEAANRRALTDPARVAREFKRRIGDTAPILLGGSPLSPQALMARMLRWVVDHVSEVQGGPPTHIAASHPANWGPYKLDLFEQTIRLADMPECTTLTEPEAAAAYYASYQRLEPGESVAVYDLGGGTFDAAVVRRTEVGFDILGTPEGIEHLGGIDIDEAVFAHVRAQLGDALDELDPSDPTALAAVARLRQECVEAKEALSIDVDVTIPVLLPQVQTQIPLTRPQLEQMVRPSLVDTIHALRRALDSAALTPDDIRAVLLVGGSSRIPLVAQLVGEELGRPVAVDTHPKHSVALGTALAAEEAASRARGVEPAPIDVVPPRPTPQPHAQTDELPAEPVEVRPTAAVADETALGEPRTVETAPVASAPAGQSGAETVRTSPPELDAEPTTGSDAGADHRRGRRRQIMLGAGGAAALLLAVVGYGLAVSGTEEDEPEPLIEEAEEVAVDGEEPQEPVEQESEPVLLDGVACDETPCVQLDDIRVEDDELFVEWTAIEFQPHVADTHALFFWDIYDSNQVGTNAEADVDVERALWELTDQQPFVPEGEMRLATRPPEAEGLCVTVADAGQAVINPDTYHCVPFPDDVALVAFCDGTLCIQIDEVGVEDGELHVEWTADGFEPDNRDIHAHFFWDIYDSNQVGTNAEADFDVERAPWELTDQQPFVARAAMRLADRPEGSEGVCVTVADGAHAVIEPANYHCLPLPDGT